VRHYLDPRIVEADGGSAHQALAALPRL